MSSSRAPAIGIDLGTCYCSVGVFENESVTIIANDHAKSRTPSYVTFTDNERFIGDAAKNLVTMNPANTIFGALRLIGRQFEDPLVQGFMKHWPFEVVSDNEGRPKILVEVNDEKKSFSPEEICSMLLAEMKTTAEKHLDRPVNDAVVTVPANFDYSQRQAITNAATVAGLNVLRLLLSPAAAAIAHYFLDYSGITNLGTREKNVLVFDLGGGTLDVAILTIEHVMYEIQSTASDNSLGGEDFVNRMLMHFVKEFRKKHQRNITTQKCALLRLRNACETVMKTLSSSTQAVIEIDALVGGIDFHTSISRPRFEEINADLFRRIFEPVEKCLREAHMEKSQIHDIVLVGGSTRIPKIRWLLQECFTGNEPKTMRISDEAVAYGAAVYADVLSRYRSQKINGAEGGRQSKKRKADGQLQICTRSTMNEDDDAEELMIIDLVDIYRPKPSNNVAQDSIATINKKILQEEIATDFAIVCESGAEIKCHKVFLCAQSGVLRAMIESSEAEAEPVTNRIEILEMSEGSVRAFLAFLYYRDTTEASRNSEIAVKLLRVAHVYDIKSLHNAMKKMIVTKETSWFGIDEAVRLFQFARHLDLEDGKDLKMKAVEILTENILNLGQSDCYKELFKNDPESAMDLHKCSICK